MRDRHGNKIMNAMHFSLFAIVSNVVGASEVPRSVFTCGGGTVVSEHHTITATIGEELVGTATSEHHCISAGFFAFVGQPCAVDAICRDDDACTFDQCVNTLCANSNVRFGDVNGSGGEASDLDDILCALNGFASFTACPNGDIAPVCTGDNVINLDDLLAVLSAFGGANPCDCYP